MHPLSMYVGSGVPESIFFHLRNCSVETSSLLIRVKCAYPGDSDAMVNGFQVIAQPANFGKIEKLYANHTLNGQTSAIVEVEQNGEFQVSVIPVLGETGIVNSSVEYSEVVVVEDLLTATGTGKTSTTVTLIILFCENYRYITTDQSNCCASWLVIIFTL